MDDGDGRYLAEMLRALAEAEAWAARISADAERLRPAPDSPLGGDDHKTDPHWPSHAVWRHLSNAVDHLSCLRAVLGDAKVINMYAPFTLVRGAVENACGAIWLLQPSQRGERLTRRFRLAISDIRHEYQAAELMGLTGQANAQARQERIDEIYAIAERAGISRTALKGNVSYAEIVAAADEATPGGLIELTWKTCSGYAHETGGRPRAARAGPCCLAPPRTASERSRSKPTSASLCR